MGYRTELLRSRQVSYRGVDSMEVRHMFRISGERPENALANCFPPLPVETGSWLSDLDLSYADDEGSYTQVSLGDALAHGTHTLQRADQLFCQLRHIGTDWYLNSTADSVVELVYQSGPDNGPAGREGKQRSVIWQQDNSADSETVFFGQSLDEPRGTLSPIPGGMPVIVPTVTMTATLRGAHVTTAMSTAIGNWNSKSFRGFRPLEVRYMGTPATIINGDDVMAPLCDSELVLQFVARKKFLNGEQVPAYHHFVPRRDAQGKLTGGYEAFEDPAPATDFRELFPTGWDPGPLV